MYNFMAPLKFREWSIGQLGIRNCVLYALKNKIKRISKVPSVSKDIKKRFLYNVKQAKAARMG